MEPALAATFIGLIATTQIHISKGLQKYGIDALYPDSIAAHGPALHLRKKVFYFTGIALNNLAFLWALVANMHAATSYYTSAFGFGLVVLMIFSEHVLHEKHSAMQHSGAAVIAFGTFLIGLGSSTADVPGMNMVRTEKLLLFVTLFYPVLFLAIGMSLKFKLKKAIAPLFGVLTGCSGALDPILKGIGQSAGTEINLIPHTRAGWLFFIGSFVFGSMAFFFTQIGFYKKARASTLVTFHNISLIILPIVLLNISLPGFSLTRMQSAGLFMVVGGIILMFSERTLAMFLKRPAS